MRRQRHIGHPPAKKVGLCLFMVEDFALCGREFMGPPNQKYCDSHRYPAALKRGREYRQRLAAAKQRAKT